MKIGIYGGTFDPIHNGHLMISTLVLENLNLDRLMIMPSYISPHKKGVINANFDTRFKWVKKAFKGIDKIEVSDYEGRKGDISYTFNTICHFEKIYGKILYVMGEDSFVDIEKWYRYKEFLEKVELWVYPRYCERKYLSPLLERLGDFSTNVHILKNAPLFQISSTFIRERIKAGLSIKGYVPEEIRREVIDFYNGTENHGRGKDA